MTEVVIAVIVGLVALIIGLLVGYILRKSIGEKTIGNAEQTEQKPLKRKKSWRLRKRLINTEAMQREK